MMSKPERLEGQTRTSDACAHVQSIANDPQTAAKLVSNPRLACKRRSITHRRARKAGKPNGRVERVHTRSEH